MRQVGTLLKESDARRFIDYLVTCGITAQSEQNGDQWEIWVRDENHLTQAQEELEEFRRDPDGRRYKDVESSAHAIRRQQADKHQQARKNVVEMRGRWGHGISRKAPLVFALIALSVLATIVTEFGKNKTMDRLEFSDSAHLADRSWSDKVLADKLVDIQQGEVWRLITPIFVHLSTMHLVFNMYWTYYFGSQIEGRRGTLRLALMVLVIAAVSNFAQAWLKDPWFGGMSGVCYGLFGYVWMKTLYDSSAGLFLSQGNVLLFIGWFFVCLSGIVGPVANIAHGAGLVTGVVIGYAPILWRDLRRE
jgi:GlpG protein